MNLTNSYIYLFIGNKLFPVILIIFVFILYEILTILLKESYTKYL